MEVRSWPAGTFAPRVWSGFSPRHSDADPAGRSGTWSSDRRRWCNSAGQMGKQVKPATHHPQEASGQKPMITRNWPEFYRQNPESRRRLVCGADEMRWCSSKSPGARVCPGQRKPAADISKMLLWNTKSQRWHFLLQLLLTTQIQYSLLQVFVS